MMLQADIRNNLQRLWESHTPDHQELAYEMLKGLDLDIEDYEWLWELYLNWSSIQSRRTTLVNFPNITENDIKKGRMLAYLLISPIGKQIVQEHFIKNEILRLPYCTIEYIPQCILDSSHLINQLIWQDGELLTLEASIDTIRRIRRLDFRRQPITSIHPNIALLPHLEEIYLISTSFIPPELSERMDIDIYTDAPY